MKHFFTLFVSFIVGWGAWAQNITISGKITSIEDVESLIGATVMVKGSTLAAITDAEGRYRIADAPANGILVIRYTGYETREVPILGQTTLDVALTPAGLLQEVVVTSFGIAREKKVLGYGSQSLSGENLLQSNQTNLVNALQGKVAGVVINNSAGAPGSGVNINIRGINSLSGDNDNQPIIVVDGIIISNATDVVSVLPSAGSNALNSNEQFMNSNRLADLNLDDIESVNILKGAAATALYGQRAANGALIITTKKGKEGRTSINYNFSYGIENIDKAPRIQRTYYQGFNGLVRTPPATVFWQYGPPALETDPFYDHFRTFYVTGKNMNHSLSFSGGNANSTFQSSLSYLNGDGIVVNSNFRRATARLAATHKMSRRLAVGAQINYNNNSHVTPPSGDKSVFSSLWFWSPSFDINDHRNPDGTQKNPFAGIIDNPRYMAEESPQVSKVNRVFGDINLNYDITPWLKARYQLTADYYNDERNRVVGPDLDLGTQVGGFIVEQSINFRELNSNFFLVGERALTRNLNLSFTLGNAITEIKNDFLGIRGERFIASGFYNIRNATNYFPLKGGSLRRLVGVFGEARLEFMNYAYLTLTGRNDWSSTLPEQNRSFFYPSVSLAYILTNHLLPNSPALSYLKLRGSWATVGKDAPPYRIGNYFTPVPGFPFGNVGGFTRDNNVGNFNLKPEFTTETEVGIEANLFNNLFSVEANYFVRESRNQIINVPVSTATGYSSYTTNAGVITNRGVELLVGIHPIRRAFRWSIDVNWTRIRGEVTSLPAELKTITYISALGGRAVLRVEEGGSVGDLYGYDWRRNDKGEVLIGPNGLPTLETARYVKVGNALPEWFGGLNNTFSYKNFTLNFLLEMRHGGDVVDLGENNAIRNGTIWFTEERDMVVRWKGVNADGTPNETTAILNQDTYRAFGINGHYSYVIQDASWFRIRNASLSYRLPKSLLGSRLSSVQIGITGRNLFLSTPFRGYDPEALAFGSGSNFIGFTGRNTPITRSFTFNVSVGF